jgi:hypothetical protein
MLMRCVAAAFFAALVFGGCMVDYTKGAVSQSCRVHGISMEKVKVPVRHGRVWVCPMCRKDKVIWLRRNQVDIYE